MRIATLFVVLLGLCGCLEPCMGGVSPHAVAVAANADNGVSESVAQYYCSVNHIPRENIVHIECSSADEVHQSAYAPIAQQIREKLVSQFHVNPNDPAHDPIQVLVMCYGIPSRIAAAESGTQGNTGGGVTVSTSVDSYLTLLFNTDLFPPRVW